MFKWHFSSCSAPLSCSSLSWASCVLLCRRTEGFQDAVFYRSRGQGSELLFHTPNTPLLFWRKTIFSVDISKAALCTCSQGKICLGWAKFCCAIASKTPGNQEDGENRPDDKKHGIVSYSLMIFSNHCQPWRNVVNALIGCDGEDRRFPLHEKRWCTKNDSAFCFVIQLISAVLLLLRKYAESTLEAKLLNIPANHLTFICQCSVTARSPSLCRGCGMVAPCSWRRLCWSQALPCCHHHSHSGARVTSVMHLWETFQPSWPAKEPAIPLMSFVSIFSFLAKEYKRLEGDVWDPIKIH